MAYAPHWLYAFGGRLDTGQSPAEIWQCGVRVALSGASAGDSIDEDQALTDWTPQITTWFQGTYTGAVKIIPTLCTLDWIKVNKIGANGKYVDETTHVHDFVPAIAGLASPQMPNIIATAVTWRTGKTRPPGAWGRVYLPAYGTPITATGSMRMSAPTALAVANSGGQLLASIVATLSAQNLEGSPVVASKVDGINRKILTVTAGDVFDVQRRRKDALIESYQTATNYAG